MRKLSIISVILLAIMSITVYAEVDKDSYNQIKKNMYLSEVEKILGPGEKRSEKDVQDTKIEFYEWKNTALKICISITFVDGRVYDKSFKAL